MRWDPYQPPATEEAPIDGVVYDPESRLFKILVVPVGGLLVSLGAATLNLTMVRTPFASQVGVVVAGVVAGVGFLAGAVVLLRKRRWRTSRQKMTGVVLVALSMAVNALLVGVHVVIFTFMAALAHDGFVP